MAIEFVTVRNPANDSVGRMSKKSFENTFADKGFELVSDDEAEAPAAEGLNTSRHPAAQGQSEEDPLSDDGDEG